MRLIARRIRTTYWRPGHNYLKTIVDAVGDSCENGDVIAISEKAVSVALGRVVDEAHVQPGLLARILAKFWMRFVWGRILGPLCGFKRKTVWRLKRYPIREGSVHKQTTIQHVGLWQSLLHYSEGGIDVTNLPFAFAALPLDDANEVARTVFDAVVERTGKGITLMLTDTDKTYSWHGFHLTPRKTAVPGIRTLGLLALMIGRVSKWKARATPLAVCGRELSLEETLAAADVADRRMGHGAGRTVWDMARRFRVGLANVTWDMLESVPHYPIVIVRKID